MNKAEKIEVLKLAADYALDENNSQFTCTLIEEAYQQLFPKRDMCHARRLADKYFKTICPISELTVFPFAQDKELTLAPDEPLTRVTYQRRKKKRRNIRSLCLLTYAEILRSEK